MELHVCKILLHCHLALLIPLSVPAARGSGARVLTLLLRLQSC